jgi:subtilase family serine protease
LPDRRTDAEAASVGAWLKSAGFTGVGADAGRDHVRATAPVSVINTAFRIRMTYYRRDRQVNAGSYPLRANDRAVTIPSSVAGAVLGVTGLDDAAPNPTMARPGGPAGTSQVTASKQLSFRCSSYYGQVFAHGLPKAFGTTSFPSMVCGYSADQVRAAYGYNVKNAGKGVTIALVVQGLAPNMFQTLKDYAATNKIQAPAASRYAELSLDTQPGCGDPFNVEEQLDVEAAYALAPLANELVVGGDACNDTDSGLQAVLNADIKVLNGKNGHPLAQITSNSWGAFSETEAPRSVLQVEHSMLVRAAAEGVTMLYSAGDISGVITPSNDPYATAVGGTSLGIGNRNNRLFETGWSESTFFDTTNSWHNEGELSGAAGGGISVLWAQPGYQHGVVPSSLSKAPGNRGGLRRTLPDISALADPETGLAVGQLEPNSKGILTYSQSPLGGTSLASPLVAAMVADAEQGQRHSFGFINPALYRLAGTNAFFDTLPFTSKTPVSNRGDLCDFAVCQVLELNAFDNQSHICTSQVTLKGYDTMTGVGTPNGQNFINGLRKLDG